MSRRTDLLLLAASCGFLFFYGLGAFGLVGADEPRYAQVAREMLGRSDWVTPMLLGKPWLEKPVLYYWQAMLWFRVAGVSDSAARVPAAVDAALLVAIIYFFLLRFRPGSALDGALMAASCAGMIGFARAAATDMPLASAFAAALIAWYAWYASGRRVYLGGAYLFLALGTLAKGPVAPALCGVIILLFLTARRDWKAIAATLWFPGIVLYLVVALPWYVAVQRRNPEFCRVFILEHNLARFSQDVYHHRQPFWFYLPVFLLAMMPWTLVLLAAVGEWFRAAWRGDRAAVTASKDSWPTFLLFWMVVPVAFFSASQSKLPGYILPAVPAGALLAADYLARRRKAFSRSFSDLGAQPQRPKPDSGEGEHRSAEAQRHPNAMKGVSRAFAVAQGLLCGAIIFVSLAAGTVTLNHHFLWSRAVQVAAAAGVLAAVIIAVLISRAGWKLLRPATLFAVVVGVGAVIRLAAPAIDDTQSERPVAEAVQAFSNHSVPVATYGVNRLQTYGLEFYLNRPTEKYEEGDVPAADHVLVAARNTQTQVAQKVPGRRVSYLTSLAGQKLDLYWVGTGTK